jgi:DNA polymerase I
VSHPFDRYREIVLGDTEFVSRPGELYHPVCVAFKELRSGRSGSLADYELGDQPPHAHGQDVLFVGFTGAEPEFYHSIGWPFDMAFLDLRVVGIHQTNFAYHKDDPRREKLPRSLIQFLRANGIQDGDEGHKDRMRERIMQGPPYTPEEYEEFKHYCFGDVGLLEQLMNVLLPRIPNFGQALMYGEFVKFTAEIFRRGQPADPWSSNLLKDPGTRRALRLRAVSDTSLSHGLYQGTELTQAQMSEFLARHGIKQWRRTKKGKLGTKRKDFEQLEEQRPVEFKGLADVHRTVKQLHELQLFAGPDGRYRTPLWAFSTITSRAAPDGAAYPFTTPAWCRNTMMPEAGLALLYLDFSSMEFGTAAGLSRDPRMIADYAKEPYLVLPVLAGLLPPNATKRTHPDERDAYKPMVLAVQYSAGGSLLAERLKLTLAQGRRLVDLHHGRYDGYWEWSDYKLQLAFENGELVARDGWRCGVNSLSSIFTARNWLIQANSAAIFRYAGLLMRRLGLPVIALVHDAVLIEAPLDQLDRIQALAIECLERASRRFLYGLTLRADAKRILMPANLPDDEDLFPGPDDEPPNRKRKAEGGRRPVERLRPLPGAFARFPVQWLREPYGKRIVPAKWRLLLYLLYRSHWGQRGVSLTTAVAAEIGLNANTAYLAVRRLKADGWVRVVSTPGCALEVWPIVLAT